MKIKCEIESFQTNKKGGKINIAAFAIPHEVNGEVCIKYFELGLHS